MTEQSARPKPPRVPAWWIPGVLVAGVAVADWMRDAEGWWVVLAVGALCSTAAGLWPWTHWGRRLLGGVALFFAGMLVLQQIRLHLLRTAWADEVERQTLLAADRSRDDLGRALREVESLADAALGAADLSPSRAFDVLGDLVGQTELESSLAILEPEGVLRSWAGRHRAMPRAAGDSIELITTRFFSVLASRRHTRSGGTIVASVLLDVAPGVPEQPVSLAAKFERKTGIRLAVFPPGSVADTLDPFDYKLPTGAGARTLFTVRFLPPTQSHALETALEAGNHRAVLLLVLLVALALWVARSATERFLLLSAVLWLAVRAPAGEALGLDTLFSPSVFFPGQLPNRSLLGPFSRSAGTLLLSSTLLLVLGVYAWRRALPRRAVGVVAGSLLLLFAPFVVQDLGRGITPPAAGVSTGLWLAWEVTLLVATCAMLVLVAALFRGPMPSRRRWTVMVGVVAALAAAVIGLFVFNGRSGWPDWYWALWAPPLLLVTLPAPRRLTILGIALVAGMAAALMTWAAEFQGRVELARRDFFALGQEPDPLAEPTLAGFAERLDQAPSPRTATDLYVRWTGSVLASQGYPTVVGLWTPEGEERALLSLSLLDVPISTIAELVRALPDSVDQRIVPLERMPGIHYVLLTRPDSGMVATAVVGPRTVLIGPSRLGRLLAPRTGSRLYRMTMTVASRDQPLMSGRERWRREGWLLRAEREYDLPGGRRVVQAVVDLGTPALLFVRGVLVVFLNAVLVALLWGLGELVAGTTVPRPHGLSFRRSFRVRLGFALIAFFLLPAAGFATWSFARLRVEAQEGRDLVIAEILRDAASGLPVEAGDDLREALESRSDRVDAVLGLYRHGALAAASSPVVAELGLLDPVMSARAYTTIVSSGESTEIVGGAGAAQPLRTGYRMFQPPWDVETAILATRQPAGDPELLRRQLDVAMVLLLATLLAAAAAMAGAKVAAGALSRPVRELREAALKVGRGLEVATPTRPPPMEFAPVFAAFERMIQDIRASRIALEESRRRTAAVLATVATGVVGLDEQGRVLIANRRARELLGTDLPEGSALADALPPEWAELGRRVGAATASDDELAAVELEAGGRRLAVQFARLDGPNPGLVMAVTDITDVTRAARVLAWGEMASQIAHEIKNPLTPMRLGIQHLQRVYLDGQRNFGETLSATGLRILGEIDRLDTIARAFSRYAAPAEEQRPLEALRLAEIVEEVLHFYRLAPEGVSIRFRDEGGEEIAARRNEAKEVLINLLENARNARAEHIVVTVAGGACAVEDDGIGIPAALLPRIFEPRFSTTTSGSGLGLAIVRRLVEGWGGSVEVESEEGRGTTVRFRGVPFGREDPVTPPASSAPGP